MRDLRFPVISTTLPLKRINDSLEDVHLGLLVPSLQCWVKLVAGMLFQAGIGCLVALFVHTFIIGNRKNSFSSALLIGYGFVIPILLGLPYFIMQWLNFDNTFQMISTGTLFALQALRCITAIHGTTTPASVEMNQWHYCIYFCSIVDLAYDEKTGYFVYTNNPYQEAWTELKKFLSGLFLLICMNSFMSPFNYQIFDAEHVGVFHWSNIVNNVLFIYVLHLFILTSATAFQSAVALLTGIKISDLTKNPIFGSRSPSDFWGRRWNNAVHKVLKDSVYRTMIPHFNPTLTAISVFLASGILHEYILLIAHLGLLQNTSIRKVQIQYGLQTLFFLFNALVLFCEHALRNNSWLEYWSKTLPRWLNSLLLIIMVLPIAHLFTQGMLEVSLLSHYSLFYPMVVVLQNKTM